VSRPLDDVVERAVEEPSTLHPDLVLLSGDETPPLEVVAGRAHAAGLRRVHVVAWRDLDDPEAGGSEVHAHRIASQWAAAGLDVTMRTSNAVGLPWRAERAGYHVVRKAGRYVVFPRSAASGLVGRRGRPDGLVEIWNGMPFFSPLWSRCPSVVFLHHVHAEMWRMVLPRGLARVGEFVERRVAPPLYRRSRILTLSESSRREIVSMLGFEPGRVTAVPPGLDPRFVPGGTKSPVPLVVAVGRLVPVKRFDLLVDALARVRAATPHVRAVIVGEGYERPALEARIRALGAQEWIELPGYVGEDGLRDVYRRAWVLASTSQREGWGMTITEAGACGTPSVATRIAGHIDAVRHDLSGLLVDGPDDATGCAPDPTSVTRADAVAGVADALHAVLSDGALRARLGRGAQSHARSLSWERTSARTLEALVDEASHRGR
jgi:glycosyltransferase involved in cell wall biosynthesis